MIDDLVYLRDRKGGRSLALISEPVKTAVESGKWETKNLMELLAVDFGRLARNVLPVSVAAEGAELFHGLGVTARMRVGGRLIREAHPDVERFLSHPSDIVRGWCAYALAELSHGDLRTGLERVRGLAEDRHFQVREWAWLAVREEIAAELEEFIRYALERMPKASAYEVRFIVEALRPRGVWCKHLSELKEDPGIAEAVIINALAFKNNYVYTSIGNWLNDAAKSSPGWVEDFCAKLITDIPDEPIVAWLRKRAVRSIN